MIGMVPSKAAVPATCGSSAAPGLAALRTRHWPGKGGVPAGERGRARHAATMVAGAGILAARGSDVCIHARGGGGSSCRWPWQDCRSSLPKYIGLWPRAERAGAQAEWWKTVGSPPS